MIPSNVFMTAWRQNKFTASDLSTHMYQDENKPNETANSRRNESALGTTAATRSDSSFVRAVIRMPTAESGSAAWLPALGAWQRRNPVAPSVSLVRAAAG